MIFATLFFPRITYDDSKNVQKMKENSGNVQPKPLFFIK